jgi:acetyltransferase-like isoleucine patch superfamily enzyme
MFAWFYNLIGEPVPYYAHYPVWLIFWKPLRKFCNVVIIPNIPFNNLRIIFYRLIGFRIGKKTFIGMKCYMDDMDPHLTTIGDNVTISYSVKFAIHGKGQKHTPIVIENGAYIGMGTILLSGKNGITIGQNAIIGAGSVVTRSVPPYGVAVGVPAKILYIKDQL